MFYFKKIITLALLSLSLLHSAAPRAVSRLKAFIPVAKTFFKESAQDLNVNKGKLAKAGLFWGGVSGAWYIGLDQLKNTKPGHAVLDDAKAPDILRKTELPRTTKIIPIKESFFNNRNNPENRWLANGKGFWGNIATLFPTRTLYVDKDKNIRVPVELLKKVTAGDKEAKLEFHEQVKDQIERSKTYFDYKTYGACALDTALLTPIFMLNPVAKALQFSRMNGAWAASYVVPVGVNTAIKKSREASRIK